MSLVAPTLQAFFTDRLARQRQASPRTIAAYRDTFRLLLGFVQRRTGTAPAALSWDDLDAPAICDFLDHLEAERGNSPRTRNARLAAIRSLFSYASLYHPEHAALLQRGLAIPPKRFEKQIVSFLTPPEVEALLGAPDRSRFEGRRDHILLLLASQAGLRVSELVALDCADLRLGAGAHVRCRGKGRKERAVPLTREVQALLRPWLAERGGRPDQPLFCTRAGRRLSRDAIEQRVHLHAASAVRHCPSLRAKRVHPHTLRHSCAMALLQAGVDSAVIALWLGHADVRSTQAYLHADLTIKERALARTTPPATKAGRYRPPDRLIAFLEAL
jgi:site-specific recombinase XerD